MGILQLQLQKIARHSSFLSKMGEMDDPELSQENKPIRQQASIPFLWEEKPGKPKKDWKPAGVRLPPVNQVPPPPPPPVKLVASVPFIWEEKPGTPLLFFQQPPAKLSSPPTPPPYDVDDDDDDLFDLDLEAFKSLSSTWPLQANHPASTMAVSSDTPPQKTSIAGNNNGHTETPSTPVSETGTSPSNPATLTSSLAGASLWECLFPSFPPEEQNRDDDPDVNGHPNVVRRSPTLGELIKMSRRRSYHRKVIQMMEKEMLSLVSYHISCFLLGVIIIYICIWILYY
ncbi:altered inheritance of mitochondria protein 3 [Malania oleifera]|uniref:altered inheritance of mitochondria protein 3 n=1 Tax=Malania oleifera TaxID=397392 RepID=UPI0025AE29C3|nr:altered inheritance of mitochondria protein 3 [Malania oleifera]